MTIAWGHLAVSSVGAQAQTDASGASPSDAAPLVPAVEEANLFSEMMTGGAMVSAYIWVLGLAFAVSLLTTPIMRRLAQANGIVDLPDARRKNHAAPVAYLGGVAILFGWMGGAMLAYSGVLGEIALGMPVSILIGAVAICLTGVIDDVYGIRARVKIGGQLIAAAALAHQGVGVILAQAAFDLIHLGDILPYWFVYVVGSVGLIAVMVIGGCNSLNLIDGLDGLSSGVTAIASIGFLAIAVIYATRNPEVPADQHAARIILSLATLGAVLGFLPYNFRPASIFMGDAGSLLLGYLCVANMLLYGQQSSWVPLLMVTACLIVFALPITDTTLAIFRRALAGQNIFAPDSMHIHHMLRRSGLSVVHSVLVMYAAGAVFAAIGVMMVLFELQWRYMLLAFFLIYGLLLAFGIKYSQVLTAREEAERRATEAVIAAGLDASDGQPEVPAAASEAELTRPAPAGGLLTDEDEGYDPAKLN